MTFVANSAGMTSGLDSVSKNLRSYRSGTKEDMSYVSADYLKQDEAVT